MNYKNTENTFEIKGDTAYITVLKKDGSKITATIDTDDVEKIKQTGCWFAEWHKDFNNYTIQNISTTKRNKKNKPLKQSIQTFILNTNPKAPIKHINGNMLDNRKCNLEIVNRNEKNELEKIDANTIAIILKDKFGNPHAKALISNDDLETVTSNNYSWVEYKKHGETYVIANTPEGRIYLDKLIINPNEEQTVHHINLNPLDCRRSNLEKKNL